MSLGIELAKKLFSFYADHGIDRKELFIGGGPSSNYFEIKDFAFRFGNGRTDLDVIVYLPEGVNKEHYKKHLEKFQNKSSNSYMVINEFEQAGVGYDLKVHFRGKNNNEVEKQKAFSSIKGLVSYLMSFPRNP